MLFDSTELSDCDLKKYVEKGELTICGHTLSGDDLKIAYSFDQNSDRPSSYEAHSDNEVG